jgi:maltose O-acetyltransferase
MTEKEKCAQGLLYNPNHDQELISERMTCKERCVQYNAIKYAGI